MKYINKKLTIERATIEYIARKYGTPAYCYSYNQLKININNFKKNFKSFSPLICFAIKSMTEMCRKPSSWRTSSRLKPDPCSPSSTSWPPWGATWAWAA